MLHHIAGTVLNNITAGPAAHRILQQKLQADSCVSDEAWRQRVYLTSASVCEEEQTSPLTAWLSPDEWHNRLTSVGCQRQMRAKPTNQRRDAPVVHRGGGWVGGWVICYRFEYITRIDVNVSGVKVQRLKSIWTHCVCSTSRGRGKETPFFLVLLLKWHWKIQHVEFLT